MSDIKKELKELEEIMHSTDEDREQKFEKKFLYIREHYTSEKDNEAIYNFTLNGYKQINNELENMTRYLELQNQIKSVKEEIRSAEQENKQMERVFLIKTDAVSKYKSAFDIGCWTATPQILLGHRLSSTNQSSFD